MNIQEYCLIPKKIVKDILNKNSDKNITPVSLVNKPELLNKKQGVVSRHNLPDLDEEISSLFSSPIKIKKAKNIYFWIKNNSPEIEISPNGNLIKPLEGVNILNFLKDILSGVKNFHKDKLEKYRIFIALLNLPKEFLENEKIRNFIYSYEKIDNKRKFSTETEDNENIVSNEDDEAPRSIKKFRKFVKKVKLRQPDFFPKETRSMKKSNSKSMENIGSGYNRKKLKQKWINY